MSEREIRLDEMDRLEQFLRYSQITAAPVFNYLSTRRNAINVDYAENLPEAVKELESATDNVVQQAGTSEPKPPETTQEPEPSDQPPAPTDQPEPTTA